MQNINIFLQKANYNEDDIVEIKNLHEGYTNKNFLIRTKDHQNYIVRFPLKEHDFMNEYHAYLNYKRVKFIDFNVKTGVYIKKYVPARHPDLSNPTTIKQIIQELQTIHQQKITHPIKVQDWFEYIDYNVFDTKILSIFYKIVNKLQDDPKVFTHHDLNSYNILQNGDEILFIDWEWARLDSPYFDYATLALNEKTDEKLIINLAQLDYQKLQEYKFLILVFSYMWCNYMNTSSTLKLKDQIFDNIQQILPKIV